MRSSRSGFTFLEILFLIGIGALLLVIVLPVYSSAKMKGRKTSCLSNLRQIGLSLQMYGQDYDEMMPPWQNRRKDPRGKQTQWDSPEGIFAAVMVKALEPRILFCSIDPYAGRDIEVFGVNHRYSSYKYYLLPPGSEEGEVTVTGVYRGGVLAVPPADYILARDANLGKHETVEGQPAYGCQHLRSINAVYLDFHVESHRIDSPTVKELLHEDDPPPSSPPGERTK